MSEGDAAGASGGAPPRSSGGLVLHSFGERLVGAIRLDPGAYAEVHRDQTALGQAAGVVALGALAQAVSALQQSELVSLGAMRGAVAALEVVTAFASWFFSALGIWVVGVKLMKRPSDLQGLLRVLGFAAAPEILYIATGFGTGAFGWLLWLGIWLWTTAAFVVAMRSALQLSSGMATVVCLAAALLGLLVVALGGWAAFELLRNAIG